MADSPYITDVTQATFQKRVLDKSHDVPVLVDFWAPWCGPCRMLTPILTQLANDYQGKFFLAKVNTDEQQELAMQFHIRGIPDVKVFRDGNVVDGFVGVQPASAIRALIDRLVPNEADVAVRQALNLADQQKLSDAVALLRQVTAQHPRHDSAKIELARLLLRAAGGGPERRDEVEKLLSGISFERSNDPAVEGLRTKLELMRVVDKAPPPADLESVIERNPNDTEARYRLSAYRALAEQYELALDDLLDIVNRDRKYGDDAARRTLVGVLALLGDDPRVPKYRALLARALH